MVSCAAAQLNEVVVIAGRVVTHVASVEDIKETGV